MLQLLAQTKSLLECCQVYIDQAVEVTVLEVVKCCNSWFKQSPFWSAVKYILTRLLKLQYWK